MSDSTKENWRYLFGAIGAIAMLLISLWLREYVDTQKAMREKVDQIYIQSVTSSIRDSLHSESIARLNVHQQETDQQINQLMQSLLESKIQLSEIQNKRYEIKDNQN